MVRDAAVLRAVSLLREQGWLQNIHPLLREASRRLEISQASTIEAVLQPIKDRACDVVPAADDELGQAVLGRPEIHDKACVIYVVPTAPPTPGRESVRRFYRERGAFLTLFADEVTLAVLEAAIDAAQSSFQLSGRTRPATAAGIQRATLSNLNASRDLLMESLRQLIAVPVGPVPFALFVIQSQRFRAISDALQTAGTAILLECVTSRLEGVVGPDDAVAYLGDGRFAVLARQPDEAATSERLRKAAVEPFVAEGEPIYLDFAIGITRGTRRYQCAEDVVRDGIIAAGQAKPHASGAVFQTAMRIEGAEEYRLEAELRRALKDLGFTLNYQPIVQLETGRPVGFESLVRWSSPTRGRMSPAQFVPVLERAGLIVDLGAWIMEQAAEQCAQWNTEFALDPPLVMSVNVSAKQLRLELVDEVGAVLERTGIQPGALKLEITETATIDRPGEVAGVLARCKELGVEVWVDDFGTGYSSLAHIQRFPIDGLKLDKSFVDPLDGTAQSSTMARAILEIARVIGVKVIAEGVETEAQALELIGLGCGLAQGYHFAKPLAVGDAYGYLGSSRP